MTNAASRCRVRLKYCADIKMGQSPPSATCSSSPEDGLPFLQGSADFGTKNPIPNTYCESPTKLACAGDILLSVRAPVGEINMADQELGIGRGLCAVRPRKQWETSFAWWALQEARHRLNFVSTGSTYDAVATEDVENLLVETTALDAQRTIADYLDHETARIDALIAAKETTLRLLAEKRRAFVTSAVTRGLDPDAPLRDSGALWLGEIPAHWETWKLGHLARVGNGSTPNRGHARYWFGGTIPWLNSGVVNRAEVTSSDQHVTETALDECHLPILRPGTVLIAITGQGKTRGRAVVLSTQATINQHLAFVDPDRERLYPWFLRWWLFVAYDFLRSISDDAGGTKGALTCEDVAKLRIALPPPGDQAAIVEHIACRIEQIEDAGEVARRTIGLLKERRAALISAAVSGRIDVEATA